MLKKRAYYNRNNLLKTQTETKNIEKKNLNTKRIKFQK